MYLNLDFLCVKKQIEADRLTARLRTDLERQVFYNIEENRYHNPYDQEFRVLTAIETGNPEMLDDSQREAYTGEIGRLADDELRHLKNTAIAVITLASRAAIRGGLMPEIAFSMSDLFIRQVEQAATLDAPRRLARSAQLQYAQMVQEVNQHTKKAASAPLKTENSYIVNCKNYLFRHLHGRVQVQEIARALNISADYLSTLFKKHEGITLSRYILRQKIRLAKNLLIYSGFSYLEIATYLGFTSQSHFGKQFRQETGLTPKQFRDRYQQRKFTG